MAIECRKADIIAGTPASSECRARSAGEAIRSDVDRVLRVARPACGVPLASDLRLPDYPSTGNDLRPAGRSRHSDFQMARP